MSGPDRPSRPASSASSSTSRSSSSWVNSWEYRSPSPHDVRASRDRRGTRLRRRRTGVAVHGNLINGEWVTGTDVNRNVNPSNLGEVVGEYARADAAQAHAAIASARAAFPGWSRGSRQERADLLDRVGDEIFRRAEELGTLLSREEGKTLPEGVGEAKRAGYIFKFFAGEVVRSG